MHKITNPTGVASWTKHFTSRGCGCSKETRLHVYICLLVRELDLNKTAYTGCNRLLSASMYKIISLKYNYYNDHDQYDVIRLEVSDVSSGRGNL